MQISITVGNSTSKWDAKEAIEKYQESGTNQRVTRHRLGRARAQIRQKHRDMTGEHECMNWHNLGMIITDNEYWQADMENNKHTEIINKN